MKPLKESPVKTRRQFDETFKREAVQNWIGSGKSATVVADLRHHRNAHEIHSKLGRTPDAAAGAARRKKRSARRAAPRCPWWPYIWSLRTGIKVGPDGRVPVGQQRLRVGVDAGARVIHCLHPNGAISILAREPKTGERPALLLQVGNPDAVRL